MLQRIQSVYLALVVSIAIYLFFTPLAVVLFNDPSVPGSALKETARILKIASVELEVSGEKKHESTPYGLVAFNMIVGILAAVSVFLFKNRSRQMLLCRINLVMICLFTGLIFWTSDRMQKDHGGGDLTYLFGSYLPAVQLILTYLAERAIKKDDKLVKSAERLR